MPFAKRPIVYPSQHIVGRRPIQDNMLKKSLSTVRISKRIPATVGAAPPFHFATPPCPVTMPSYLCSRRVGAHEPIQVVHSGNRHPVESDQPIARAQSAQGCRTASLHVHNFDHRARVFGFDSRREGRWYRTRIGEVIWLVGCILCRREGGGRGAGSHLL